MGSFFSGSNWNDPHVIKVGSQFVMYASADVNFTKNIKIYRLVSNDGVNWNLSPQNAVFERPSSPSEWDSESVETPAVVYFKNQYYLFYTGYDDQTDPTSYSIGYATSPDGISWTRRGLVIAPSNPSGIPDLNFRQYVVAEPAPVVFNGELYLYFAAQGANMDLGTTLFSFGLITTSDGQNWSAPLQVLKPDQTLYPRSIWHGYSTPHAQVFDNKVHLYFDVAKDPFKQERLHHASSSDGKTNWSLDSEHLLSIQQIPWADDQINGPSVLVDKNILYLWFGAQGNISNFPNINMGISLATCQL